MSKAKPYLTAIDFAAWIEAVTPELKPPVGNKLLFGDGQQKVMIVGGPNQREDYHIEEGEELFYMIKGNMTLNVIECGKRRSIPIREGEVFLLPRCIPHSPQREANTVGLVLERERLAGEQDGLRWYVPGSEEVLYQEWFHCTDLGTQLKPIIDRFFASPAFATKTPAADYTSADTPVTLDTTTVLGDPVPFAAWAAKHAAGGSAVLTGAAGDRGEGYVVNGGAEGALSHEAGSLSVGGEYLTHIFTQPCPAWETWQAFEGEVLVWQHGGTASLSARGPGGEGVEIQVLPGHVCLVPAGHEMKVVWADAPDSPCLGWVVTNSAAPSAPAGAAQGQ